MTTPYQRGGVRLPDDFAATLHALRQEKDPRLAATLKAAKEAGWSPTLLGHVLGVSGTRIAQLIKAGEGKEHGPIPPIPAIPAPTPTKTAKRPPKIELTADEGDQLRAMHWSALGKQGVTFDEFHAAVFDHWQRGAPMKHLAEILRCGTNQIQMYVAYARSNARKKEYGG